MATDLADVLVERGVPFREAHEAVGRIVGHCVNKEIDLRSLTFGVGNFEWRFDHLQELTGKLADKVIQERQAALAAA